METQNEGRPGIEEGALTPPELYREAGNESAGPHGGNPNITRGGGVASDNAAAGFSDTTLRDVGSLTTNKEENGSRDPSETDARRDASGGMGIVHGGADAGDHDATTGNRP